MRSNAEAFIYFYIVRYIYMFNRRRDNHHIARYNIQLWETRKKHNVRVISPIYAINQKTLEGMFVSSCVKKPNANTTRCCVTRAVAILHNNIAINTKPGVDRVAHQACSRNRWRNCVTSYSKTCWFALLETRGAKMPHRAASFRTRAVIGFYLSFCDCI